MRTTSFAFWLAMATANAARGADTGVGALKLVLRESGAGEKLVFVSKDSAAPFPAIGSTDDPASGTPGGLTLDLITATGVVTVTAPPGSGWTTKDGARDVYRFTNPLAPAGPSSVRTAVLRQGRVLKVVAKDVPLALTGVLGAVGVRVVMGGTRICARFEASTVVSDEPGVFVARHAVTPPADCVETTLGLVPECGNGVVEFGEECDGTQFGTAMACTMEPGVASAMCQADCTCCALGICNAFLFQAPCCPGLGCRQRIGPDDVVLCEPLCSGPEDCQPGQVCLNSFCRTPNCTSDTDCGPDPAFCLAGVCCVDLGGPVCP